MTPKRWVNTRRRWWVNIQRRLTIMSMVTISMNLKTCMSPLLVWVASTVKDPAELPGLPRPSLLLLAEAALLGLLRQQLALRCCEICESLAFTTADYPSSTKCLALQFSRPRAFSQPAFAGKDCGSFVTQLRC